VARAQAEAGDHSGNHRLKEGRAVARNDDQAGVRFPPPLVFIGFLLIGLLIGALAGRTAFGLPETMRWSVVAVFLIAGLAIVVTALTGFKRAGTPPEPWTTSTTVVDTGIYAITRNPMYLAMALLHIGLALAADSVWGAAMVVPAIVSIQTQVIRLEEAYLTAKFGDTYRSYQRRVRRWF
jgi:protein-S-isoprenylcysteine O-methyltransferase Ste14